MGIIDSHGHLGRWKRDWNEDLLLPELLSGILDRAGVAAILVSNLSGIDTRDHSAGGEPWLAQREANLELLEWCRSDPRLLPLAVCQPGLAEAAEIEAQLSLYKFYGLKFHPFHLNLDANDPVYDPFMEAAAAARLPAVFHAAPGCSDPEKICELAARHPRVPTVLYHINLTGYVHDGIKFARQYLQREMADLYLELSWVPAEYIKDAVAAVGHERVLFGTDAPLDGPAHYDWYRESFRAIEALGSTAAEAILEGNSRRVFRLP